MRARDGRKVNADNAADFIALARAMAEVSRAPVNLRNAASGIFMSAKPIIEKQLDGKDGWAAIRVKNEHLHYQREALEILERALALDGTDWMARETRVQWRNYIDGMEKAVEQARKAGQL